jgi:hypothetical protein
MPDGSAVVTGEIPVGGGVRIAYYERGVARVIKADALSDSPGVEGLISALLINHLAKIDKIAPVKAEGLEEGEQVS